MCLSWLLTPLTHPRPRRAMLPRCCYDVAVSQRPDIGEADPHPSSTSAFSRNALAILALLSVSLSGPIEADTVQLTNGRTLDGRAVVLDSGDVELYSSMGMIRLPKSKVAAVRKAETAEDRILSALNEIARPTAEDLFEFAQEARLDGATTLSVRLFKEALRLDPNHEPSRTALGYRRTTGGWQQPDERDPKTAPRESEAAERLALLRALRAQAMASQVAERQRQLLLALQAAQLTSGSGRPGYQQHYGTAAYYGVAYTPQFQPAPMARQPRPDLRPSPAHRNHQRPTSPRSSPRRSPSRNTLVRVAPP